MDNTNTVGTLAKAGAILDAVELGPQDLTELVALAGLPRATCHRLAAALVDLRLLTRSDGRYAIGPRIVELAAATTADRLRAVALPTLRRLRDETRESAQVYRRQGERRLCVASVEPPTGLRDTVPEGALLRMSAGSAAQVLTAWGQARSAFPTALLDDVRQQGWAQSVGEREPGVASVSAPIDRLSRQPGVVFGEQVVAAAARVSEDLRG